MDVKRPILRRRNNELGNVALFVAVVLPVALIFTILPVDVIAYHSHRVLTQQRIDSIVAKATKLLPNTVVARTFINSELECFDAPRYFYLSMDDYLSVKNCALAFLVTKLVRNPG